MSDERGIIPRTSSTAAAPVTDHLNQLAADELPSVLSRLSVTGLGDGVRAAMSKLSEDQHRSIFGHLCNALDPRAAVDFSSASLGLWALTEDLRQQLRAEHEAMAALCLEMELRSCKELREANNLVWLHKGHCLAPSTSPRAVVGHLERLGKVPRLVLCVGKSAAIQRLFEGLGVGALPAVTRLSLENEMRRKDMRLGDAGFASLAAALGRDALPRLETLILWNAAIGDAGLVGLAPALRRLPALEQLFLDHNPFGDEGLAALVAPPLPAGARVLTKLKELDLVGTQVTDAGCAALAAALDSGALPALETIRLATIDAVRAPSFELQPALALALALPLTLPRSPRHHTCVYPHDTPALDRSRARSAVPVPVPRREPP